MESVPAINTTHLDKERKEKNIKENMISPEQVKKAVYNRIDFKLPEEIWEEIDEAFGVCWNKVIGFGNEVDPEFVVDFIAAHLKKKHILLGFEKVKDIVSIILDYIEMTRGFLDDTKPFIPVFQHNNGKDK